MTLSDIPLLPRSAALRWLLVVAVVSVGLRVAVPPHMIETLYSRGLFVGIRTVVDAALGWIPVPLFFLFWAGILYLLVRQVVRFVRSTRSKHRSRKNIVRQTARLTLTVVLTMVTAFLWLWGFNYGRLPVEEQLQFATYQPDLDELRDRVHATAATLAIYRRQITGDTTALTAQDLPYDLENSVRPLLAAALVRHGYPAAGRPRAWELLPRGILLRFGTAGVYWPWVAEGNVDAGLHPLQKPAVLAHELAHAYGFGDEGTCSFWAQLSARETTDHRLRYAIELSYWRQIAGMLRYADPENYLIWRAEQLDPGIRNDLQAIYDNGDLYQDIAPVLRDATYTAYLKAQGIHDGLLNYGRVVQLVEGYRRARVGQPERK
ncbi:hypothetical protein GGR28_000514 [Lewinella aquimaris]|uniref:DUF3810 domain-containing protein n=1 Tax=Neolewinella aquimaris TaxID=1835722 RepID=A0A840E1T0_9BACT|nr:DUF3810 family protein [Neolewinella aquimaris]MBB4077913.1 hypothetical protein [Neolewinella aquimaris]